MDMQCTPWPIIFSPLIVLTATISLSVFLRMDLVRRALYTMPNSPAMNGLASKPSVCIVSISFGLLEMAKHRYNHGINSNA